MNKKETNNLHRLNIATPAWRLAATAVAAARTIRTAVTNLQLWPIGINGAAYYLLAVTIFHGAAR